MMSKARDLDLALGEVGPKSQSCITISHVWVVPRGRLVPRRHEIMACSVNHQHRFAAGARALLHLFGPIVRDSQSCA